MCLWNIFKNQNTQHARHNSNFVGVGIRKSQYYNPSANSNSIYWLVPERKEGQLVPH